MPRVVVTGVGVVSALGPDRDAFWDALCQGRSGIGPIELPEGTPPLRFANAAQVHGFDPAAHFEHRRGEHLDRFAQFGVVAAREAVADAGVVFEGTLRDRTAIVTGRASAASTRTTGVSPTCTAMGGRACTHSPCRA
jgi:nodulation protein E